MAVGVFLSSVNFTPDLLSCARAGQGASFARWFNKAKVIFFLPPSLVLLPLRMAGVPSPLLGSCLLYLSITRLLCWFSINGLAHHGLSRLLKIKKPDDQGLAKISQTGGVLSVPANRAHPKQFLANNIGPILVFTYGAWSINGILLSLFCCVLGVWWEHRLRIYQISWAYPTNRLQIYSFWTDKLEKLDSHESGVIRLSRYQV